MEVPHEFIISLIKKDKIVERVCKALGLSIYDESGDTIIERIHTLQTVYELHEKNYEEKVQTVPEGESTELISSPNNIT